MRFIKNNASPRDVLSAAVALYEASEKILEALSHLNGKAKTSLLDNYIQKQASLRFASVSLESDFASCVAATYDVSAAEVPLLGSAENLRRAEDFLLRLEKETPAAGALNGVKRAVSAAGGQVKLASQLGVTQQAVSKWLCRGWVPVRRAVEIEHLLGVPRHELVDPRLVDILDTGTGL